MIVLIGVALYSVTGFLLAPRLLKNWLEAAVAEHSEKRLRIQEVTFNPYTFLLTLTGTTLNEANDDHLLSIPEAVARIDITRLFARTLVFRDAELRDMAISTLTDSDIVGAPRLHAASINFDMLNDSAFVDRLRIEQPDLRIERDPSGRLNLPGWLVRLATDPATAIITIHSTEIAGARASFTDRKTTPHVRLESDAINGTIVRQGTGSAMTVDLDFRGRLFESGAGSIVAGWRASDPLSVAHVELMLNDVGLASISPYVREITGHELRAGRLDLALEYDRDEGKAETQGRIIINDLHLEEQLVEAAHESWPLDLAIALLEDDRGRIDVRLPALSNEAEPEPGVAAQVIDRLHDLVVELAANPFREMAVLAGARDEQLERVPFAPGSAEISPQTLTQVAALSMALSARPRLGVIAYPAYDPVADRLALATQQVRLHVALATSAGPPGQAVSKPIDFSSPKVRAVLDEFSGARLAATIRSEIGGRFPDHDAQFYGALFEALVEQDTVPATALERLARYRAQSIVNALVATGIPATRLLRPDEIQSTEADQETVNLRLEATVLDSGRPQSGN